MRKGGVVSIPNHYALSCYGTTVKCTLVSLTVLMSSLDHLRGLLSASQDGCFSCARLQLHPRTIEIRTGFGPCSIWLKILYVT